MAGLRNSIEVEGFNKLVKAIESMPDKVKRPEMIKIMIRQAKPLEQAIMQNTPVGDTTNLKNSVASRAQRGSVSGGNAVIFVGPQMSKGVYMGFHRHLVIKGHKTPSGGMTKKNPYVNEAAAMVMPSIKSGVSTETLNYLKRKSKRMGFEARVS